MAKLRTRFRIFMDSAEIQGFSRDSGPDLVEIQPVGFSKIRWDSPRFSQDSAGFRDSAHKFSASGKDSGLNSSLN